MKRLAVALLVVGIYAILITVSHEVRRANDPAQQAETLYLSTHGTPRSPHWPAVRREFLKTHDACAVCGSQHDLECHHVEPFAQRPDLELSPDNLIVACRRCHLLICHLSEWRSWNPDVRDDAAALYQKIKNRPR